LCAQALRRRRGGRSSGWYVARRLSFLSEALNQERQALTETLCVSGQVLSTSTGLTTCWPDSGAEVHKAWADIGPGRIGLAACYTSSTTCRGRVVLAEGVFMVTVLDVDTLDPVSRATGYSLYHPCAFQDHSRGGDALLLTRYDIVHGDTVYNFDPETGATKRLFLQSEVQGPIALYESACAGGQARLVGRSNKWTFVVYDIESGDKIFQIRSPSAMDARGLLIVRSPEGYADLHISFAANKWPRGNPALGRHL
jgi:hypothetical protein